MHCQRGHRRLILTRLSMPLGRRPVRTVTCPAKQGPKKRTGDSSGSTSLDKRPVSALAKFNCELSKLRMLKMVLACKYNDIGTTRQLIENFGSFMIIMTLSSSSSSERATSAQLQVDNKHFISSVHFNGCHVFLQASTSKQ